MTLSARFSFHKNQRERYIYIYTHIERARVYESSGVRLLLWELRGEVWAANPANRVEIGNGVRKLRKVVQSRAKSWKVVRSHGISESRGRSWKVVKSQANFFDIGENQGNFRMESGSRPKEGVFITKGPFFHEEGGLAPPFFIEVNSP